MGESSRLDRCPFVSQHELGQCRAHHALIFDPEDQSGRRLPATLTCSYLRVGDDFRGRFYPRCAIGDETARQSFVEHRNEDLNAKVTASLLADSSAGQPDTGVMVADDAGKYVAVNGSMCAMLGYEREDMLLGMSVWDLTPERYGDSGAAMWGDFIAAGEGFGTYQLVRADGSLATFDFIARANVIPGLHVSILTPSKGRAEVAEK
ncbi:MAG TPA: PAS domain-containing protein [Candidatus Dormibacteraeota bacterium]|nr:PAS domain-containing protein [Candidatus Dormibacteraeota bacterium]